jgi:hypothetical protein
MQFLLSVKENNVWETRANQKLMNLYRKPNNISEIGEGK